MPDLPEGDAVSERIEGSLPKLVIASGYGGVQ